MVVCHFPMRRWRPREVGSLMRPYFPARVLNPTIQPPTSPLTCPAGPRAMGEVGEEGAWVGSKRAGYYLPFGLISGSQQGSVTCGGVLVTLPLGYLQAVIIALPPLPTPLPLPVPHCVSHLSGAHLRPALHSCWVRVLGRIAN